MNAKHAAAHDPGSPARSSSLSSRGGGGAASRHRVLPCSEAPGARGRRSDPQGGRRRLFWGGCIRGAPSKKQEPPTAPGESGTASRGSALGHNDKQPRIPVPSGGAGGGRRRWARTAARSADRTGTPGALTRSLPPRSPLRCIHRPPNRRGRDTRLLEVFQVNPPNTEYQ